jgi:hypothetical protein
LKRRAALSQKHPGVRRGLYAQVGGPIPGVPGGRCGDTLAEKRESSFRRPCTAPLPRCAPVARLALPPTAGQRARTSASASGGPPWKRAGTWAGVILADYRPAQPALPGTRQNRCQNAPRGLWRALLSRPLLTWWNAANPDRRPTMPRRGVLPPQERGRADCRQKGLGIFMVSFRASFWKSRQGKGKAENNGRLEPWKPILTW